jgi:molecular chaperone DnaK
MSSPVLGIDLGTSNSVVSAVLEGEPIVIPDDEGHRIHPSVVYFGPDGTIEAGKPAERRLGDAPGRTVLSSKRLIGRSFDEPEVQKLSDSTSVELFPDQERQPNFRIDDDLYSPEQVSAHMLGYLKKLSTKYLGTEINDAVITVPANFDERQRRATKQAAEMSDLNLVRLLNEPTAAALAYGYGQQKRQRVAVYDLGGGTFDITVLELRDNVFEVLATAGDTYLGGDDLDRSLVDTIISVFEQQYDAEFRSREQVWQRLKGVAKDIKHTLARQEQVKVEITEYLPDSGEEVALRLTFQNEQLETLVEPLVERTLNTSEEALDVAGIEQRDIDHLVLVGGSTRLPLVRQKVHEFFGQEPAFDIDPDEVVSLGASIFGTSLQTEAGPPDEQTESDDPLLIDVTPHALGVKTVGGVMDVVIERNGSLPLERTRRFSASHDNQERIVLPVYAGNSRRIENNRQLGVLKLEDIEPGPREEVQIEVTFEVDTNGMVGVRATDLRTGLNQFVQLSLTGGAEDEYSEEDLAEAT